MQRVGEKILLIDVVDSLLEGLIKDVLEGTLKGASKNVPNNLHKDPQEGAFRVALKGVSEILFVGILINASKWLK